MNATVSEKITIIDFFGKLTLAGFVAYFLGFISGAAVARVLGPEQYGLLNYLTVFQQWGMFVGLGFISVAVRNLPILIGRGDTREVQGIRNNCYTMELMLLGIYYLVILVVFAFTNSNLVLYFLLIAVIAYVQKVQNFYSAELYASKKFNIIIPSTFWGAIINTAAVIVLVYLLGVYGALLGYLIGAMFYYIYYRIFNPFHFSLNIQPVKVKEYFKMAIPLHLTTLGFWGMRLVDKTVIAALLTKEALGFYSFAAMVSLAMQFLVDTMNRTFQPYFFQKYGETDSVEKMEPYVEQPLWVLAYATPFIIALGYLFFPLLVNTFFPQYASSIGVFSILVFSMFFFSLTPPYSFQLNVEGKLYRLAATQFISLGLDGLLSYISIRLGYGIIGVAWAALVSWVTYSLLISIMAKRVKHLFRPMLFLPFFMVLFVYYIYQSLGFLYALPLLVVSYIPFFIILNRKTGVFTGVYNRYIRR